MNGHLVTKRGVQRNTVLTLAVKLQWGLPTLEWCLFLAMVKPTVSSGWRVDGSSLPPATWHRTNVFVMSVSLRDDIRTTISSYFITHFCFFLFIKYLWFVVLRNLCLSDCFYDIIKMNFVPDWVPNFIKYLLSLIVYESIFVFHGV